MWAGKGRLAGGAGWPSESRQETQVRSSSLAHTVSGWSQALPDARSGVVLFTRPVDVLEQSHGKGHSQDLEDKERTLKGCSHGLGSGLSFISLELP